MQFLHIYILACFCSGWSWYFLSIFSAFFRSSYNIGLVVTKSLSICLSVKDFISSSLMKLSLAGFKILGWKFFSLKILSIGPHSHLAWRFYAERSAVSLMAFPFWVTQPFFLAPLNIFSFVLILVNLTIICLGVVFSRSIFVLFSVFPKFECCSFLLGGFFLNDVLKSIFQLGFILFIPFWYTYQT